MPTECASHPHHANSIPAGLDSVSSTVSEVPMYSPHYVDVSADMHTCAISAYYTTLGMLTISSTDLRDQSALAALLLHLDCFFLNRRKCVTMGLNQLTADHSLDFDILISM